MMHSEVMQMLWPNISAIARAERGDADFAAERFSHCQGCALLPKRSSASSTAPITTAPAYWINHGMDEGDPSRKNAMAETVP